MKNKGEKGSITIFVLCMCLFTTIALMGLMMSSKNKLREQEKQQKIIQEQYNEAGRMNEIYEKAVKNQ